MYVICLLLILVHLLFDPLLAYWFNFCIYMYVRIFATWQLSFLFMVMVTISTTLYILAMQLFALLKHLNLMNTLGTCHIAVIRNESYSLIEKHIYLDIILPKPPITPMDMGVFLPIPLRYC